MKTRNELLTILCLLTLILAVGCGKIRQNPEDVLSKYLDASLHGLNEEAYLYVSEKDKKIKTKEEYLIENKEKEDNPFAKALASKITYTIESINGNKSKADAIVAITMPDFGCIFMDIMGAAFVSAFGGEDNEAQIEKVVAEKYFNKDIPLITTKETFTLLKETDGWKVFLDWETEKIKAERNKKIESLLLEAEQLEKKKKLYGALEKYNEVLELDSETVEAKIGKEETEKEIGAFKEKQAYIHNVELYDVEARYFVSLLEGKGPGVRFKIKNKGNKTLVNVEVTVYFKDADGNIIAEEDYHPVSEYSSDGVNPLKPNYIWQIESGKFYQAETVPTEWEEGSVSAKITDIEFGDDTSPVKLNSALIKAVSVVNEVNSREAIATHEVSRNIQKEKEEYIVKHLLLQNIRVGEGYGVFDMPDYSKPKKGIFGTIKNTGNKNISSVQITVYYLDSDGRRVGEKVSTVLSTSSLFDADPPLRPNYSKDFGYIIEDDASPAWTGKIEVEISDIEFEKS